MERPSPLRTPLQYQIDEFIAEGASWLPVGLLRKLVYPIGQLLLSGAAEQALKERAQASDFLLPDQLGKTMRLSLAERQPQSSGHCCCANLPYDG